MSGIVYLIAGPSGSGKTTLTQALVQRLPELTKVTTVTTRLPRQGEVDGVDYHFVSPEQFSVKEQTSELIESDHAYNESYGVPRSALKVANDVAIIITTPGALSLKRLLPNAVSIFIMPASAAEAAARVHKRNSPNASARLGSYEAEVVSCGQFDEVFLNLDFDTTVAQLERFILARSGTHKGRTHLDFTIEAQHNRSLSYPGRDTL